MLAMVSKIAVIKKQYAKKRPSNADTKKLWNNSTIKTVGIVAVIIKSVGFERGFFIQLKTSFLKAIKTAKSVAICINNSKPKDTSTPKSRPISSMCPLDEMGKNSVNPCTNPIMIASNMVIGLVYAIF